MADALKLRLSAGAAFVFFVCAWPTPGAAQPTVRVRSETRIELRTEHENGNAILEGILRDDRGEPLPSRVLRLSMGGRHRRSAVAQTDGRGRARFGDAPEVEALVAVAFGGDATHEPAHVERTYVPGERDPSITLRVAEGGRFDLSRPQHEIVVESSNVALVRASLYDELDRKLASAEHVGTRSLHFRVDSRDLGPPGPGRLRVVAVPEPPHPTKQIEIAVTRILPTTLAMDPVTYSARGGASLRGRLATPHGPLSGEPVSLVVDHRHYQTILTDSEGGFTFLVDPPRSDGPHQAQVRFDGQPGYTPSQSQSRVLAGDPNAARAPFGSVGFGVLALVVMGVLVLDGWRRRQPRRSGSSEALRASAQTTGITAPATGKRPRRRQVTFVAGTVTCSDRLPIAGARITAERRADRVATEKRDGKSDASGSFRLDLSGGVWTLTVRAPGYQPARAVFTVPHEGNWSRLSVVLERSRDVVARSYFALAARLLGAERVSRAQTFRELSAHMVFRTSDAAALETLSREAELLAYGEREPTETELRDLAQRIDRVASSFPAAGPTNRIRGV